jgi:hypothetical protein
MLKQNFGSAQDEKKGQNGIHGGACTHRNHGSVPLPFQGC